MSSVDIFPFVTALGAALVLTPAAGRVACAFGILDHPAGIKDHKAPTPYLGGVAIYLAVMIALMTVYGGVPTSEIRTILTASTVVMLFGLLDDLRPCGPWLKFLFQGIGVVVLVAAGVRLHVRALPEWMNIALTFFWVMALTNAVNIIDIMDGLASGVCVMAGLAFMIVAVITGQAGLVILSAVLVGSCLGFLVYNAAPASIFMGDCGSQFLGFLLAAIAMGIGYTDENEIALFAPLMILAVPLYDLFFVMVIRLLNRRSPFRGSKDHLALRLRFAGFSVTRSVLILYLVGALMGLSAVSVTRAPLTIAAGIYLIVVAGVLAGTIFVSRIAVPQN